MLRSAPKPQPAAPASYPLQQDDTANNEEKEANINPETAVTPAGQPPQSQPALGRPLPRQNAHVPTSHQPAAPTGSPWQYSQNENNHWEGRRSKNVSEAQ